MALEVVRVSSPREFPRIIRLAHDFNEQYYTAAPLDEDKLYDWLGYLMEHGVIMYSPEGFIAGFPVVDPVRNWTSLVEHAWYARDRSGITLLRAFIEHGRNLRVNEVRMTTLNTTPAGVNKLLRHYGFEEIETSHRLLL